MRLSNLITAFCFLIFTSGAFAQGFQGSISFTKSNMMDVTEYVYHVKDNMVRIDERIEGNDKLVATLLVNLETEQMVALSHERNLYMTRPKKLSEESASGLEVKAGDLKRSIKGRNCSQYRIKNKEADREVMYWVTEGEFAFLPKLLKILKRKDNFSTYYLNIPDLDGKFPMMAQENTLLREKKGFLQVDNMEEKILDVSMFDIPDDYQKVEK